jgi:hypothetical protein
MVDRFSKEVTLHTFNALSRAELLIKFLEEVFLACGVPDDIISDCGPQFLSGKWARFCKDK